MRNGLALTALLIALAGFRSARAQGIYGLNPPHPGDLPVAPGKGIGFEKRPSSLWYNSGSSFGARSAWFKPSWSYSLNRITFLSISPSTVAAPQPVVIVPAPKRNRDEEQEVERIPPPAPREVQAPPAPEALAPGTPASVFRPIRPEDRAWALVPAVREPAKPAQPTLPAMPESKEVVSPPAASGTFPGPPAAPRDARIVYAQFTELGNEAFKASQYGRAERSFRRATEELPRAPRAYFLLAQAQFALGKYAEAVTAIQAGMQRQPDWPSARFRPREFYRTNSKEFPEQLQRLADVLITYPDDPVLTFLYAYELWFDNRKDEARMIFQRAKALAPDPSFSERFLQTKADTAVSNAVIELFPPGPRF
jgi:hypothetical protein